MKQRIFITFLLLALLLAACGKPAEPPVQSALGSQSVDQSQPAASLEEGKITFTDALGQDFSIDPPRRAAVMIGSFADVWVLAGGEGVLAATANDAWESYGLDLPEDAVNIGSPMKPNVELVLAAEPDLIIASSLSPSNLELREIFGQAGIPAAYFDVSSLQDYLDLLELFTRLTGHPENYQKYGADVLEQIAATRTKYTIGADGPTATVLTLQVSGTSVKVKNSHDNVLGEMLNDLDCVNIADQDESLLEDLSLEAIIQADPDFIFAVYHGTDEAAAQANLEEVLLSNPAWAGLRAVEEGNFHILERRMYSLKPNALWGDAYEKLADILCGE